MSKPFKLSATLYGHSLDVRCVTTTSNNCIVSASRDKTARFWTPNGFNTGYTETITYHDQKNFVSAVLYVEDSKEFPEGAVITGGNDNVILIYRQHEPFATFTLKEHTNAVCALSKGAEPGWFLSGSWDGTAKLWTLANPQESRVTFSGHTAAIWAVIQLQSGNVVTASADKTIGIYAKDGPRLSTLQGHTDCVRDLADFPELNIFMSVSNDASIKVWLYTGENVETYYGHTNYIYSIARNKSNGDHCFVTCDEDRTVRYWKDGQNTETLYLPAQSIWSVACLTNGDIVTGSSDGVIRIFTQEEGRFVSESALATYEAEVAALKQHTTQEIGGVKVSDLPGKEALFEPGKKAGQLKMVREPQGVVAYTWVMEGDEGHWDKVGDVLGGNDEKNAGKTTHEGKSYDYVFSVDVEDGKPPLKLPYNKGEDPYVAAHTFIEKNMLPSVYLDQVVEFIRTNSKEANTTAPASSDFVDPFTGATRYKPQPSTATSSGAPPSNGFSPKQGQSEFFPLRTYRSFDMGDPTVILGKLKEFNQKSGMQKMPAPILENLIGLCTGAACDSKTIDDLFTLLTWPDEILFPVLDIIRLSLRFEETNRVIAARNNGEIIEKLKYCISSECRTPNVTVVALRTLCNFFAYPYGEELIFANRIELLENATECSANNKNIQVGLATFLLNLIVLSLKKKDEIGVQLLVNVISDLIIRLGDQEAQFRALVGVGTLITDCDVADRDLIKGRILENDGFIDLLKIATNLDGTGIEAKVRNCSSHILNLFHK